MMSLLERLRPLVQGLRRRRRARRRGGLLRSAAAPRLESLEAVVLLSTTPPVTATLPLQVIDNLPRTVTLPQFDPGLGQLTSVQITAGGMVIGDIIAENLSSSTSVDNRVTATLNASFSLSGPGLTTPVSAMDSITPPPAAIGPFDGAADQMGADTVHFTPTDLTVSDSGMASVTDPAALGVFVGNGTLTYSFLPTGQATAQEIEGNLDVETTTQASGQVTIVYTYTPNAISGYVYTDCNNNNGLREPGEPGIEGVTLTLSGTDDLGNPVSSTTTTDASGFYQFTGLRSGTYSVTETQPEGYLDGLDTKGNVTAIAGSATTDVISGITIANGSESTENNFGELTPGGISGSVYLDLNGNGLRDTSELGLSGVTITLTGTNDLGTAINQTATTDASGNYSFTGLRPGSYTLTETQPAVFLDGLDSAGNVTPIAGSNTTDVIAVNLAPCSTAAANVFGELRPAALVGYVYADCNNNNGLREAGEPGIASVTLTLTGTNDLGNAVNLTTTTDANGFYSFESLRPGTYTVTETQPAGYLDGLDTKGNVTPIPGSATTDVISGITLNSGDLLRDNNFGELTPGGISGSVYYDANNNGTRDAGELGIPGVTITLTGTNDLGTAINQTATTDASGNFSFAGLRPGGYTLTEAQPAGFADGIDARNNVPIAGSAGSDTIPITLAPCSTAQFNTFGETGGGSLSGFVYGSCMNPNGIRDPGEMGFSGVPLALSGTDAFGRAVSATTTSGADGFYQFANLAPGTYAVTVTSPPQFFLGQATRGNVEPLPGMPAASTIPDIVVGGGSDVGNNNFGLLAPGSISGVFYDDTNGNNVRDAGEPGRAGLVVDLNGTNDLGQPVALTTTSGLDGTYRFDGLRPGTYRLTSVASTIGGVVLYALDQTLSDCQTVSNGNVGGEIVPGTGCVTVTPRTFGIHAQASTIVLGFDAALDPARAQDLANYQLVSAGRDGKFGTADDRVIPLRSATYNAGAQAVTLAPADRLKLGQFFMLTVNGTTNGVAGPNRQLMDLSGNCGNFTTILGRGKHLIYTESDGDAVGLALRHGGLMELYRAPNGDAQRLALYDALPYRNQLSTARSLLRGHIVHRSRTGNGLATIPVIEGANQVRNELTNPPFVVGQYVNRTTNPPAIGLPRATVAATHARSRTQAARAHAQAKAGHVQAHSARATVARAHAARAHAGR